MPRRAVKPMVQPLRVAKAPAAFCKPLKRLATAAHSEKQQGSQTFDVDDELVGAVRPLIGAVCREMASHMESCKEAGSEKVAAAALAAAEANGAVPPLSARQRDALKGALARAAAAFQSGDDSDLADFTGDGYDQADPELIFSIKPLACEVFETMVNARAHTSSQNHTASPHDSAKLGGEVGNISLQSASGRTGREMPRGVPAEGGTERAEHEANDDYMELEMMDSEGGRRYNAAAPGGGQQAQHAKHDHPHGLEGSLVMDQSDSPVAGDGMQTAARSDTGDEAPPATAQTAGPTDTGDEEGEPAIWRPIREHYQRHEPATDGS
ncbi:hypothetical protein N2152v2_005653 [Parachlorella kessleri]